MVGEIKILRTTVRVWRFEHRWIEGVGLRWVVTWESGGEGSNSWWEFGRWATWKAAINAVVDEEERLFLAGVDRVSIRQGIVGQRAEGGVG